MNAYDPPRALVSVETALDAGDFDGAFRALRPFVEYPGQMESDAQWRHVFELFARISVGFGDAALASTLTAAALDDAKALYSIGYDLVENRLHGFAATVLRRAVAIGADPLIVSELSAALESLRMNAEAARVIRESGLDATSAMLRYMLAFHLVMSGDLKGARELLPSLVPDAEPTRQVVEHGAARIRQMIARADMVRDVTSLSMTDLRGWHFVLHGAILTHLSPFGFDEGMHGRYAFVQDSFAMCHEGIERLRIVIAAMETKPTCVYVLADRDSAVLGLAAARMLGLPAVPWSQQTEPGLVVAYDLDTCERDDVLSLLEHRTGQVLFAHATCWTGEPPYAADITTYFYQHNTAPWGAQMRVDPETKNVVHEEPNAAPVEAIADQIVSATSDAITDGEVLSDLVETAARSKGLAAQEDGVSRTRLWDGSPVSSNAFA